MTGRGMAQKSLDLIEHAGAFSPTYIQLRSGASPISFSYAT